MFISVPGKMERECCSPVTPTPGLEPGTEQQSLLPLGLSTLLVLRVPHPQTASPAAASSSRVLCCMGSAHRADTQENKKRCCFQGGCELQAFSPHVFLMGINFLNRKPFWLSLLGPLQRKPAKGHSKYCESALTIRERVGSPHSFLCTPWDCLPSPWFLPKAQIGPLSRAAVTTYPVCHAHPPTKGQVTPSLLCPASLTQCTVHPEDA